MKSHIQAGDAGTLSETIDGLHVVADRRLTSEQAGFNHREPRGAIHSARAVSWDGARSGDLYDDFAVRDDVCLFQQDVAALPAE